MYLVWFCPFLVDIYPQNRSFVQLSTTIGETLSMGKYFSTALWESGFSEEQNGEAVNDAVFEANARVMELANVVLRQDLVADSDGNGTKEYTDYYGFTITGATYCTKSLQTYHNGYEWGLFVYFFLLYNTSNISAVSLPHHCQIR